MCSWPASLIHSITWPRQFHVDKLSSAHVYLRMKEEDSWDAIPQALLEDCSQLTKANSIEGASIFDPLRGAYTLRPCDGRQQERQHHHHLHTLVESPKGWQYGRGPSVVQRPEKGAVSLKGNVVQRGHVDRS